MQLDLLPSINPFELRFGRTFFSEIPSTPGVYFFKGEDDEVIYIGKSKDLKKRLNSYRYITRQSGGRSRWKLIHQVRSIVWEEMGSDYVAQSVENDLIHDLKPEYNKANKFPEYYHYLHLNHSENELTLRFSQELDPSSDLTLGAFKSRKRLSPIISSYLAWAWFLQDPSMEYIYPQDLRDHWVENALPVIHPTTVIELIDALKGHSDQFVKRCLIVGESRLKLRCPLTRFRLLAGTDIIADSYKKTFSKQRYMTPDQKTGPGFVTKVNLNNWVLSQKYQKSQDSSPASPSFSPVE